MDYFTSSMPRRHASAHRGALWPVLTRRGFVKTLAVSAAEAVALGISAPRAGQAVTMPSGMSGAEYVAMLGGCERPESTLPTMNLYPDTRTRWVELASGPLAEAIDRGKLTVCPACRFVNYPDFECRVCAEMAALRPDDVALLLSDYTEDGEVNVDDLEQGLADWRKARALDLFDGPEDAYPCAQALYAALLMRVGA